MSEPKNVVDETKEVAATSDTVKEETKPAKSKSTSKKSSSKKSEAVAEASEDTSADKVGVKPEEAVVAPEADNTPETAETVETSEPKDEKSIEDQPIGTEVADEITVEATDDTVVETSTEQDEVPVTQHNILRCTKPVRVYSSPNSSSKSRIVRTSLDVIADLGDYLKVAYVRHGFGVCIGYVRHQEVIEWKPSK